MAGLKIITDTDVLPVSDTLAKLYMRIDAGDTSQDEIVAMLIGSARDTAELRTARSFITRSYREYFDSFPGGEHPFAFTEAAWGLGLYGSRTHHRRLHFEFSRSPLVVPLSPANAVTIGYLDQTGTPQTVDASTYIVNSAIEPARVNLLPGQCWPCPKCVENSVWIDYDAGYGADDTDVPAIAKNAMCLLIQHFNENRDAVQGGQMVQLPYTIDNLLDLIRVYYQP